jgi:RNA polymerase sigma-70 factor (ECF subfamily)
MTDFDGLYRTHRDAVFRFAVRCVGNRELAEEVTSEAFLALYQHLDRIDAAQLPSWLFTVVRNRATDHWRRKAYEQQYLRDYRPADQVEQEESVEAWLAANPALKAVHRVCLILRYVYGYSRAEIAGETGLTETQVKGHLQYALTLLRKERTTVEP